jgi:hypothetical protein
VHTRLIEKADLHGTAEHIGMLILFEWGNSSVMNGRAKMSQVYEICHRDRFVKARPFFKPLYRL